ncbi:MAG: Brix domain-containing protein [Candidatus Bathyarchaeales archaeon]
MILLTTSRRPTKAIRTFCRDLLHTIPNTLRINRGKLSLEGIAEKALEVNAEKVLIVERWKGGPGKIQFFDLSGKGLRLIPPLIYLKRVKLQREFQEAKPKGRRIKSLALAASQSLSVEVKKLEDALSKFFGIPIISYEETMRGYDALMQIILGQQGFLTVTFRLIPERVEVGPRIGISHLIWEVDHEG